MAQDAPRTEASSQDDKPPVVLGDLKKLVGKWGHGKASLSELDEYQQTIEDDEVCLYRHLYQFNDVFLGSPQWREETAH